MEIGSKVIAAAGIGLFMLGGLSVYVLMTPKSDAPERKLTSRQHSAMQAAVAQLEQQEPKKQETTPAPLENSATLSTDSTEEMTHAAFIADAEARRMQNMEDKAEAERLDKLRKIKQNSTECKFWKQQQKSSSAAERIEEKIIQFCTLQNSSSQANSEATSSVTTSDDDLALQNNQEPQTK